MARSKTTISNDDEQTEVVRIELSASITDTGAVARLVKKVDGSIEVQTYVSGHGWVAGIVKAYSLLVAFEDATEENLAKKGYTPEQIAEILSDPSAKPGEG
jgi:hypothetical protein